MNSKRMTALHQRFDTDPEDDLSDVFEVIDELVAALEAVRSDLDYYGVCRHMHMPERVITEIDAALVKARG
jgi:hypothetical protein